MQIAITKHQFLEFLKFLLAGGFAALVNVISRFVVDLFTPFEVAVFMAHVIGMVVAFILFKQAVFTSTNGWRSMSFRFTVVNIFGVLITVFVSSITARSILDTILSGPVLYFVAHVIGVSVTAVTSYVGHKFYTFR